MNKKIAVLMTCYNRVETTLACLRSLFAQTLPEDYSIDVWLVDDASPDKTGERVKAQYPQVNVINGPGNLFWCKGMRLAWDKAAEFADYDFYLWFNDDTHLNEGALNTALTDYEYISRDKPDSVICGTFTAAPDTDFISYGSSMGDGTVGHVRPNGTPIEIFGNPTGNFVLVSKAAYKKTGKMYGKYAHGFADFDYGLVLKEKGCHKFVASRILGWCKPNYIKTDLRTLSFWKRISLLWSPKGYNVHDAFIYRYRHWGLCRALLSAAHVVCIVIFAKNIDQGAKYKG